jgi:hypothetical protein
MGEFAKDNILSFLLSKYDGWSENSMEVKSKDKNG